MVLLTDLKVSVHTPTVVNEMNPLLSKPSAGDGTEPRSLTTSSRLLLQVLIIASMVTYFVAQTVVVMPAVMLRYFESLGLWWQWLDAYMGWKPEFHFEMQRVTYFFLYAVLPLLFGLICVEMLREKSMHRIASIQVLRVGAFLRRKPSTLASSALGRYLASFSYGEILFHICFFGGNLFMFICGWLVVRELQFTIGQTEFTVYTLLRIIGVSFGYMSVYNMAFVFLPITRNSAWLDYLGISYANGMKYHRWLGVWSIVASVIHAIPFYFIWAHEGTLKEMALPCFTCKLDYKSPGYHAWFNVFGEISLIFLLIVAATSIPYIRRNMYETFYLTHLLSFLGVIFAVMHWNPIVWWLAPSLLMYYLDRVVARKNAMQPVQVSLMSVLSDDILKVVVKTSTDRDGAYQVGQFVHLNVPSLAKQQWHPFTISSSPNYHKGSLTILLKTLGDWTQDLVTYAHKCNSTGQTPVVCMEGFYGASLEVYKHYPSLFLIGGGIGATPMFAILEDIAAAIRRHEWQEQPVYFLFSFRELSLLQEIHPVLCELRKFDPSGQLFKFDFYLTKTPDEETLDKKLYEQDHGGVYSQGASSNAIAFAEPLRSRSTRVLLYTSAFLVMSGVLAYLTYDGGKIMSRGAETQYWPLENFTEIMVVFFSASVAKFFFFMDKHRARKATVASVEEEDSLYTADKLDSSAKACTYRDLLAKYDTVVGHRPDITKAARQAYNVHPRCSKSKPDMVDCVGTFVSGPEALKEATDIAAKEIGTHLFDIHDEEFEL